MKVALAFWGLTRSLKNTYSTIQKHILEVLENHNIEYTIFVHTYYVGSPFTNTRAGEYNLQLDNNEYDLLNADYIERDDQDIIKQKLNLILYRTHPDPWETNYQMVDNFVLAMYSKKQVGKIIQESGQTFDYVLFLRPDVQYVNDLNPEWFGKVSETQICVPDFHCFSFKINDRFAIATQENALKMSQCFDTMLEYSKTAPLHSETFQYNYVTKLNLTIAYIPFYFNRIRANGVVSKDVPTP
jgi:hypothetical protein